MANLYRQILMEVSYELLKKQFVDSGKVTEDVFKDIEDASNNRSAYATWLLKKVSEKMIKPEDVYKFKEYLDIYDRNRTKFEFKDINLYKTKEQVADLIRKSVTFKNEIKKDPSLNKGVEKKDKYKQYEMGTVNGFTVYEIPKGRTELYGMSCDLGSGTEWCTATGKTEGYFDEYINQGALYIFIKPNSKEKYQLFFPQSQFMDEKDIPINISDHKNLFQFLSSKGVDIGLQNKIEIGEKLTDKDLNIDGDLILDKIKRNFTLPDNLKVKGSIVIRDCENFRALPDNIEAENLTLSNIDIRKLPPNLKINGNIYLYSTPILEIPSNLKCSSLELSRLYMLEKIPIFTNKNMTLSIVKCESLNDLPNNLTLKKLYIEDCQGLSKLPENLTIDRLEIEWSRITERIPTTTKVRILVLLNKTLASMYGKGILTQADLK